MKAVILVPLALLAIVRVNAQYGPDEPSVTQKPKPSPQPKPNKPSNVSAAPKPTTSAPSKPNPVKEAKKPQPAPPAQPPAPKGCTSDVLFVLDSTGSVRDVYEQQRQYILDIVRRLEISNETSHVGLIVYSSKERQQVLVELDHSPSKEAFISIITSVPFHGGVTATGSALQLAVKALDKRRVDRQTLVLVLTDGFSFDNTKPGSDALHALSNVNIVAAGNAANVVKEVLDEIAGDPSRVLLGEENKSKVLSFIQC